MGKPSNGIIIYLGTIFIAWFLNITRLWSKIFESILKIGIEDSQSLRYIEEIFIKQHPSHIQWVGTIIGGGTVLVIMIGIFKLKSWARKMLLFFSSIGIITYAFNIPKLLAFYKNIATVRLWLGYYLFAVLIFFAIGYLISILIYFSRRDIKAQFK